MRLFERDTRNVRLTEHGLALLPLVEVTLNNAMQSAKDIRELIETKRNKVRMAAVSSVTSYVLPKLIAEFETAHPGVKVEVDDVTSNEHVFDGRADIGIGLGPFDLSKFVTTFLFSDPLAVVVSQRHPFARLKEVTWAEVGLQPIVSYHSQSHVYEMIDRALAAQRIRYEPRGTFRFRQTLFGWALNAQAVTILPSLSLERTMPAGLVHIPLTSPVVERQYYIFTRKGRALVRHAQDLLDHLKRRLVEVRGEP